MKPVRQNGKMAALCGRALTGVTCILEKLEKVMSDRKTFIAQAQGKTDFKVEVIESHNGKMIICTEAAAIYITKEQAIKFFNLKESEPNPHAALIAQCDRDRVDYPDFYMELYQFADPLEDNKRWLSLPNNFEFDFFWLYRQHPHRASIIEYHQCSDSDKKKWQFKPKNRKNAKWEICSIVNQSPSWNEDTDYRMRPKVCQITINGKVFEYPEPVRKPLNDGDGYWYVYLDGVEHYTWYDDSDVCKIALKIGGIHLTEQAAQQHLEVFQAVNAQVAK